MELLKLVALDRDDLEVVSTHLQDATLSVGDVIWRPAEKRPQNRPNVFRRPDMPLCRRMQSIPLIQV